MKKFRISMIVLLLAGVLLGGVGAGAAFAELSELKFNEVVWYGMENLSEEKLIYEIQDPKTDAFYCYRGFSMKGSPEIIEDYKVPKDEIWFELKYNPDYGEVSLEKVGSYGGDYLQEDIHIWLFGRRNDGFAEFMEIKDRILNDLKENVVSSYRFAEVAEMKVLVHPQNADKIYVR